MLRIIRYSRYLGLNNGIVGTKIMTRSSWSVSKVRDTFVDYFANERDHSRIMASPVVPVNDPTLLFTNAGMNQFKSIFLGTVEPNSPFYYLKRAANSQKCIRAGGKHNDLTDVGKDTYHHTFFEMLGTWSFGDYFKEEAIEWALDLLLNKYNLPKDRIYVSYFAGCDQMGIPCDHETKDIWLRYLPPDRVLPFGSKENFWEMGETGPCGPCSEIHFDTIGNRNAAHLVNRDDPTVMEIWNLVFMQYRKDKEIASDAITLKPLPAAHVDTGMGLERITAILQNKTSNYDTDVFSPILSAIHSLCRGSCGPYGGLVAGQTLSRQASRQELERDVAYRAIADHIRTLCVAIADGVLPSNEHRGYVIRRIVRRAIRHGMVLGAPPGFLSALVPVVVEHLGGAYRELISNKSRITATIAEEEKAFSSLLPRGVKYIDDLLLTLQQQNQGVQNSNIVPGKHAFFLYDSLGFPVDLTQMILEEKGFVLDMTGFDKEMNEQRRKSRESARASGCSATGGSIATPLELDVDHLAQLSLQSVPHTDDSHKYQYSRNSSSQPLQASLLAILQNGILATEFDLSKDSIVGLILDKTPFYAEAGGQISDTGVITATSTDSPSVSTEFEVVHVQSYGPYCLHTCRVVKCDYPLRIKDSLTACPDQHRKDNIVPNHSMTHMLNFALRRCLPGSTIDQRGSQVTDEKLRFDFTHSHPLSRDDILNVEKIINSAISTPMKVYVKNIPLDAALQITSARAVFGERYPDPVRVVSIGAPLDAVLECPHSSRWLDYSIEFCGGNHVECTSHAKAFVITEETSISKGIRRISAITGQAAIYAVALGKEFEQTLKTLGDVVKYIESTKTTCPSDLKMYMTSVDEIQEQANAHLRRIDSSTMSIVVKSDLRDQLESIQKTLSTCRKRFSMTLADDTIAKAVEHASSCVMSGQHVTIFHVDGETFAHSAATKKLIQSLREACPTLSFVLVVRDVSKISCMAVVSEADQLGLDAASWITDIVTPFGGKGGGKSNFAQGTVPVDVSTNISLPIKERVAASMKLRTDIGQKAMDHVGQCELQQLKKLLED